MNLYLGGRVYQQQGQYVDENGQVCFLDGISSEGFFVVHDGETEWWAGSLYVSEFTSGEIKED